MLPPRAAWGVLTGAGGMDLDRLVLYSLDDLEDPEFEFGRAVKKIDGRERVTVLAFIG